MANLEFEQGGLEVLTTCIRLLLNRILCFLAVTGNYWKQFSLVTRKWPAGQILPSIQRMETN